MSKQAFSVSPSSIEVKHIGWVTRSRSRRTNRFDMIPAGVNVGLSSSMCSARARTEVKLATAFPLLAAATTPRAAVPPTGRAVKCRIVTLLHRRIKALHVAMDGLSNSRVISRSSLYDRSYFQRARMRAPTSIRICCALRSEAAADTSGQVIVSKNCSNVAGMKRVLAA